MVNQKSTVKSGVGLIIKILTVHATLWVSVTLSLFSFKETR